MNACLWQSICQQTILMFSISLTETVPRQLSSQLSINMEKGHSLIFQQCLAPFPLFILEKSSIKETVLGQSQGKKTLTFPYTLFEAAFYRNRKTL